MSDGPASPRRLLLLTFRLDVDQRQRLKARLAADGRTMSEVITNGLHQYVQLGGGRSGSSPREAPRGVVREALGEASREAAEQPHREAERAGSTGAGAAARPVLPEATAARLRELRVSGRSGVLSATLAALHADGWPLPVLAEALGISKQAVQARIRQRVSAELRDRAADCPPPAYPRRRQAPRAGGRRPHLTIKIDHGLRAAAHRAAAREGRSLSQVIETILDKYLRHGPDE